MWIGAIEFDLLLGDVHSLKEKRSIVRPLVADLKRFEGSVAEVGHTDLHRRSRLGFAVTSGERRHVDGVLDKAERLVADYPATELLSAHRKIRSMED